MSTEIKITKMEKDIEFIKITQKKMDDKFDSLIMKIDKHIADEDNLLMSMDEKYGKIFANKYVEKGFWAVLSFLASLVVVLITFLLKQ